jgi:hypothetical protein
MVRELLETMHPLVLDTGVQQEIQLQDMELLLVWEIRRLEPAMELQQGILQAMEVPLALEIQIPNPETPDTVE